MILTKKLKKYLLPIFLIFAAINIFFQFSYAQESLKFNPESKEKKPQRQAFIVVQGITAATDARNVKEIFGSLAQAKIPFMLGINPILGNGQRLTKNPYLVRNIRFALSKGGVALLQGDFTQTDTDKAINAKIDEMVDNEIIPLGFTGAGNENSSLISNHFSTLVKNVNSPFETSHGAFQTTLFTQFKLNKEGAPNKLQDLFQQLDNIFALRDVLVGIAIDPDCNKRQLREIIRHLKRRGYQFLDLDLMPNFARSENAVIFSKPQYYAVIPIESMVYADKKKIDLIKFYLNNKFLVERQLNPSFDIEFEKTYELPLKGGALIDLADRFDIFLVKQVTEKPSKMNRLERHLLIAALGKLSSSPLEDLYRIITFLLFLITFFVAVYFIYMLIQEIVSRKSYRGI